MDSSFQTLDDSDRIFAHGVDKGLRAWLVAHGAPILQLSRAISRDSDFYTNITYQFENGARRLIFSRDIRSDELSVSLACRDHAGDWKVADLADFWRFLATDGIHRRRSSIDSDGECVAATEELLRLLGAAVGEFWGVSAADIGRLANQWRGSARDKR